MSAPYDELMASATSAAGVAISSAIATAGTANATALNLGNTQDATHYMALRLNEFEERIDYDNLICLQVSEQERKTKVDFASLALAVLSFALYDSYYDKYQDVVNWRNDISDRIKDCLESDIDHYIDIVMAQMNSAISSLLGSPRVTVNYGDIISRYRSYGDMAAFAANSTMQVLDNKSCNDGDCSQCGDDLRGWATMNAISAADDRARFDEARVPRRLDVISGSLDSAHSSTFNLPALDYQALSNAAEISSSLASAYSGIANSALGTAGYFSANFANSLSAS